jgi:hypothetical protein
MDDIINLIASDSAPSEISDAIKNSLYARSMDRVNDLRTKVASSMFTPDSSENEENTEYEES